jgi:hypothetical protein
MQDHAWKKRNIKQIESNANSSPIVGHVVSRVPVSRVVFRRRITSNRVLWIRAVIAGVGRGRLVERHILAGLGLNDHVTYLQHRR